MTADAPTATQEIEYTAEPVLDVPPDPEPVPERLEVFRDVPDFDKRTLVLKYGENLLDLQFCGCVNKYKKRFSAFLEENKSLYETIKAQASVLVENGYKDIDVKEILDGLRYATKLATPASSYLKENTHDFTLDSLPRAYLIRKLMMEEPKLFSFFHLSPVKCRSNCGYGAKGEVEPEDTTETDIAGF